VPFFRFGHPHGGDRAGAGSGGYAGIGAIGFAHPDPDADTLFDADPHTIALAVSPSEPNADAYTNTNRRELKRSIDR
jgi:hypothetical protein